MITKNNSPKRRRKKKLPAQINTQYFKGVMRDRGITQAGLAAQLQLDPSSLSRRLVGKLEFTPAEAARLARVLGVPLGEVLSNLGIAAEDVTGENAVPVVGWIDDGANVRREAIKGPRRVLAPPLFEEGEALRFQTAGGVLDAYDGAVIYYQPAGGIHSEALGRLCVVTVQGGTRLVGILKRGYQRGLYTVTDPAGRVRENLWIESATPVVWVKF